jgi:hypothetical protein
MWTADEMHNKPLNSSDEDSPNRSTVTTAVIVMIV